MKNIVLVGFMGTGKTVIGKALAEDLKMTYVSTDDLIEEKEGRLISEIFADKGEEYFRKKEKDTIIKVSAKSGQIIDTGGGVVLDPENMDALKKNGVVICLWANPDTILERTKKHKHRPLLEVDDPKQRIQELLENRKPFYDQANFHINTTASDITDAVDRIIGLLREAREVCAAGSDGSALWELLLNKLLQDADSPIMITDHKGRVVFANTKCMGSFGLTSDNIVDRNWVEVIVPEANRDTALKMIDKVARSSGSCQFEIPIMMGSGKERYFNWISSPLKGNVDSYLMLIGRPDMDAQAQIEDVHPAATKEIVDIIFTSSKKKEPGTAMHSLRVTSLAVALANKLGVDKNNIERLRIAALLHDIGKLVVDENILFKKGLLDKDEFDEIKKHPGWGVEMVQPVSFLEHVLPIMMNHHESYDGNGYPKGLKGKEIPYEARILAIADVYEALTADRPYRKAFSQREAIAIMEGEKGKKLDPVIADVFLDMVRNKEICDDKPGTV